jgi:hypothetical protein
MKAVNVTVTVQLEVKGENTLVEVQIELNLMNEILSFSCLESDPQIFVESVDNSNILESMGGFEIGDEVEVPDPNETDLHQHSFVGTIIDFRGENAIVEDSEGDCFEIESDRLSNPYN